MEAKILGEDFLRPKLTDVFPFINKRTTDLHALDLKDLTIFYIGCEMIRNALLALLVPTLESKHLIFWIVLVANGTH